jgi:hypothetical protein
LMLSLIFVGLEAAAIYHVRLLLRLLALADESAASVASDVEGAGATSSTTSANSEVAPSDNL